MKSRILMGMGLLGVAGMALAAPADQVKIRVSGYKALGAAYKSVNDSLRSGSPDGATIQRAAGQIRNASREQYKWFPVGSGPQAGVKTAAQPAIWARAPEFRAAQDAFARQADAFQKVAATNDFAAIKAESRKLGAACKGCHDNFRAEDD
ncbi:MAG TPA: cytochrome c [Sphingobium sp.]